MDGVEPRLSPDSHYTTGFLRRLHQNQLRPLDLAGHLAVLVSVALVLCSFRKVPKALRESSFSPRTQEGGSTLPENNPNTVSVSLVEMV
jgi:hypothetical protein